MNSFRAINDIHGQACGDRVLECVASSLMWAFPSGALVARVGGDAFLRVLRRVDSKFVLDTLSRVRAELTSEPLNHDDTKIPNTFSGGGIETNVEGLHNPVYSRADAATVRSPGRATASSL
ncbi:GGDEF domain-containing protein [Litorivivens sp.]|uniref:GGDEF domain-containing protein n=2 Tax=Litorivivens sp. TaxID=2020868 RepID=UPI0035691A76